MSPREGIAAARLLLIWPGGSPPDAALATEVVAAGVPALEYRPAPAEPESSVLASLEALRPAGAILLLNDLVVLANHADGVHVGEDDTPVAEARRRLGEAAVVGRTARGRESLRRGFAEGADYVAVGALAASRTKADAPVLGVSRAAGIARGSPGPVFAVGGASAAGRDEWRAAGFGRFALSGAVLRAPDPVAAAADWARWVGGGCA